MFFPALTAAESILRHTIFLEQLEPRRSRESWPSARDKEREGANTPLCTPPSAFLVPVRSSLQVDIERRTCTAAGQARENVAHTTSLTHTHSSLPRDNKLKEGNLGSWLSVGREEMISGAGVCFSPYCMSDGGQVAIVTGNEIDWN